MQTRTEVGSYAAVVLKEINLPVRFVRVRRDQVKGMVNSLFESGDEVHAPGKQQVHLVC